MREKHFRQRVGFGVDMLTGSQYTKEEQEQWKVCAKTCAGCAFYKSFGYINAKMKYCDFDADMQMSRPGIYINGRFYPEYPKDCSVKMGKNMAKQMMALGAGDREKAIEKYREESGKPLVPVVFAPGEKSKE